MQTLLDMRNRDGSVPDHYRPVPDLTASTPPTVAEQHHGTTPIITSRAPYDKVHPSTEKGVEFDTIGGAANRPTTYQPINRNRDGAETESIQDDKAWATQQRDHPNSFRNPSVPISNVTYGGPLRLSKNVPESDALDDGSDPTFRQWKASILGKFRERTQTALY
jgi:hypothetical protein